MTDSTDSIPRYVELHAASAFSFLEGASQPERLIERAVELELPAMALLDRNGVYGSARFHTSAQRNGVRAHVGAEVAVSDFGLPLFLDMGRLKLAIKARPRHLARLRSGRLCQSGIFPATALPYRPSYPNDHGMWL